MSSHSNEPLPAGADPTDEVEIHETREEILANRKLCMYVFGALLVGTVLTVVASWIPFSMWGHIGVALLIAVIKALLVILFFMHFLHEKVTIKNTMYMTLAFAFVLFALTWLAWWDPPMLPFEIYGQQGEVQHGVQISDPGHDSTAPKAGAGH